MSLKIKLLRITLLPLIVSGAIGCSPFTDLTLAVPLFGSRVRTVEQLQEQQRYGNVISLEGTVTQVAPFLSGGAYQMEDDTGSIWIMSEQELPTQGEIRRIKGKVVYQSIPIAGREFGEVYLMELEQLEAETEIENNTSAAGDRPIDDLLFPHKHISSK